MKNRCVMIYIMGNVSLEKPYGPRLLLSYSLQILRFTFDLMGFLVEKVFINKRYLHLILFYFLLHSLTLILVSSSFLCDSYEVIFLLNFWLLGPLLFLPFYNCCQSFSRSLYWHICLLFIISLFHTYFFNIWYGDFLWWHLLVSGCVISPYGSYAS